MLSRAGGEAGRRHSAQTPQSVATGERRGYVSLSNQMPPLHALLCVLTVGMCDMCNEAM